MTASCSSSADFSSRIASTRDLFTADAALLLDSAGRDEQATGARAPRIVLDRVANEAARKRLVAGVAQHRVHHDRRIADDEEPPLRRGRLLTDGTGDGDEDI